MATQTNKDNFSGGFAKVLKEQWQVDVRLKAGDSDESKAISAHKLVLASRSEVLKQILESDDFKTTSDKVETISFSEMKQEELEALVAFMYSDGSILSASVKQHARALYPAAEKYEILHLRDLCRQELISSLNLSNALDTLEISQIPFDANSDEFEVFVASNPKLSVEIMKASLITGSTVKRHVCRYNYPCCNNCGLPI